MANNAEKYNSAKIRLKLICIFSVVLYLGLFQIFASRSLKIFAFSFTPNFYSAFTIYLVLFSLFHYLFNFPLYFYSAFVLEHKFKLSGQPFFGWLKDDIKRGLLSLILFLVFIHVFYILLRNFEKSWWIWMAVFWFFATVFLAKITPTFIIPLFFKYYPVGHRLKKKIIALSEKCKIKILDVYKIDLSKKTNKLNAALVGVGKTRRVILGDNLIRDFSDAEIDGVLAHEFAHHKLRHMWKLIAFGAVSIFFSFYVLYLVSSRVVILLNGENIYDIKIFPAILLILFITGFLTTPLQNGFSRKLEKEADLFALKTTRDKNAFTSLMQKLSAKNLADPNPPKLVKFLFYDHPPIHERIKFAKDFK